MALNKRVSRMLALSALTVAAQAQAGVVFGNDNGQITGGIFRWDAAPRSIAGNERSLDGGLRYAMSGTSYEGFRDQFSWNSIPSVADFTAAVQGAFLAWAAPDPVSGLASGLSFVHDSVTPVAGQVGGGSANVNGAEIDLIATTSASFWGVGNSAPQGESWFNGIDARVTLTSGVMNYADSRAISGADIYLNSNAGALYSLDFFRRLLTHEIGHALGLGDVDIANNRGLFIDDNFDPNNPAASLNNSWAALVNPLDPSASIGLKLNDIGDAAGIAGVDLLMESFGLGIAPGNPVTALVPLSNDEYGTRQFLYPMLPTAPVPELSSLALSSLGLLGLGAVLRRRRVPA